MAPAPLQPAPLEGSETATSPPWQKTAVWCLAAGVVLFSAILLWGFLRSAQGARQQALAAAADQFHAELNGALGSAVHSLTVLRGAYLSLGSGSTGPWEEFLKSLTPPEGVRSVALFEGTEHPGDGGDAGLNHPLALLWIHYFTAEDRPPAGGDISALKWHDAQTVLEGGEPFLWGPSGAGSSGQRYLLLAAIGPDARLSPGGSRPAWLAVSLDLAQLAANAAGQLTTGIEIELHDDPAAVGNQTIFATHPDASMRPVADDRMERRSWNLGGRTLSASLRLRPGVVLPGDSGRVAAGWGVVLLVALLLTAGALAGLFLRSSASAARQMADSSQLTRTLQDSEARIRAVIDHAPDGIITFRPNGAIETLNAAAERLFRLHAPGVDNVGAGKLIPDCLPGTQPAAGSPGGVVKREVIASRLDGTTFPAEVTVSPVQLGGETSYTCVIRDISQRKKTEDALRESEQRYALAARATNDGLWDWDLKCNEVYYSTRWKSMLGLEEDDVGNDPDEWLERVHLEDRRQLVAKLTDHAKGRSDHFESEYRILHRDETYRWMVSRGIAVRNGRGDVVRITGSQSDISSRKKAEEELLHEATHDPLTGLPNRSYFLERLEAAASHVDRTGVTRFALLFLDLDDFKIVNDSLGHAAGDQLLLAIAERLGSWTGGDNTVARLGGDEFAVLLEGVPSEQAALQAARRLQRDFEVPFSVGGQDVHSTVSVGIALGPSGSKRANDYLREADIAMYRAKALGRAHYEVFDPSMQERADERMHLETELRRAVEREEFVVEYQPIVDAKKREVTRCEALIRWNHPERGLLYPGDFIHIAEESGLVVPMSEWLLDVVCQQAKAWQLAGHPVTAAVNISQRHLRECDLFRSVTSSLEKAGLDAKLLQLELTESALLDNPESTVKPFHELEARGVQICLDDFGTGYSSLVYLRRFPISTLKIDGSFVRRLEQDRCDANIVAGMIHLAHMLDLRVIGESVETEAQLRFLRDHDCDEVQGNLISPALEASALGRLLRQRPRPLGRAPTAASPRARHIAAAG